MTINLDLLQEQIKSMRNILPKALNYHFKNYSILERLGCPGFMEYMRQNKNSWTENFIKHQEANEVIKFELQSYINHVGRLYFFIKYFVSNYSLLPPNNKELLEVWHMIISPDGIIHKLRHKWGAHRSVDDPRGEDDQMHYEVTINLDSSTTIWIHNEMVLMFGDKHFNLARFHHTMIKFTDWLFPEIEKTCHP